MSESDAEAEGATAFTLDSIPKKAQDYLIRAMRQGDPEALFIRGNQLYSGEWA